MHPLPKIFNPRILFAASLALALALFGAVSIAQAYQFSEDGYIAAGTVIDDDVFVSADTVTVDGTVNGILFANGSTITINGTVNGDLFANGNTVTINGQVNGNLVMSGATLDFAGEAEGSVFAASQTLTIAPGASIGRNLYFGGFSLDIQPGASIAKDLAVGSYQVVLAGQVDRNIDASTVAFEVSGKVGGNLNLDVEPQGKEGDMSFFEYVNIPGMPETILLSGLRVAPQAEIVGELKYTSSVDQAAGIQTVPGGGVVYTYRPAQGPDTADKPPVSVQIGNWFLDRMRELVTLSAIGALVIVLLPKLLPQGVQQLRSQPWSSLGKGLLVLILSLLGIFAAFLVILTVGILLSIITLGGLKDTVFGFGFSTLGLFTAVFWLMVNYGSKLLVASLLGSWLFKRMGPTYAGHAFWPLLAGIVTYVILRGIPVLGVLFGAAATLIGLGAAWLAWVSWRKGAVPGLVPAAPPQAELPSIG